MSVDERTMATMTMESRWEKTHHEMLNRAFPYEDTRYFNITSEELYRCIDEDWTAYPLDSSWGDDSPFIINDEIWNPKTPIIEQKEQELKTKVCSSPEEILFYNTFPLRDPILSLPEALTTLVNPRTGLPVTDSECRVPDGLTEPTASVKLPSETIKPYHPTQDHDYLKMIPEEEDVEVFEEMDEDEPVVDVWKIENFGDEQVSTRKRVSEQLPAYQPVIKKETRRTSKRTADIRRREQARRISNAVHAVLNIKKPANIRQYKNIKPKNSVETTPSQSDIEEWHSQPVRPTHTKVTKKKTSKGRIDHSESERHRREVLRRNFHSLSELIPVEFLRGEKASSQISKQKILNGGKAYIAEMLMAKSSYKALRQRNELLRDNWQKRNTSKLPKCIKRQK